MTVPGDTNNLSVVNGPATDPYTEDIIPLTDNATGLNQLSGITLSVGDTINGTVTLNNPITVSDGIVAEVDIDLELLRGGSLGVGGVDL